MYQVILVTIPLYAWTNLCWIPVQRRVGRDNATWTVSVERIGDVSIVLMQSVNQRLSKMDVKFLVRKDSQVCLMSDRTVCLLSVFLLFPSRVVDYMRDTVVKHAFKFTKFCVFFKKFSSWQSNWYCIHIVINNHFLFIFPRCSKNLKYLFQTRFIMAILKKNTDKKRCSAIMVCFC